MYFNEAAAMSRHMNASYRIAARLRLHSESRRGRQYCVGSEGSRVCGVSAVWGLDRPQAEAAVKC